MFAPLDDGLLGVVLEDRYRLVGVLGRGGMGTVYQAEDTRLQRRCAVKVLHASLAEDRKHVERFLREAQMIARLDHPGIVEIYSYGEDPPGIAFFAMEFLHGEDLDTRLKRSAEHSYDISDACAWAQQIAQAVAAVHEAGMIHRDLKTSNVFLARRRGEERCKLLDFGIARPEDSSEMTTTGTTLGTPSYMSPEQIQSAEVDRRSDIYSFGVLMYKLLTGKLPFAGDAIQIAWHHCNTPAPVPSVVAPSAGISPDLDAIVLKALAKDPGDRYATIDEVEAALTAALHADTPDPAPRWPVSAACGATVASPAVAAREPSTTPQQPVDARALSLWLGIPLGLGAFAVLLTTLFLIVRGAPSEPTPIPQPLVERAPSPPPSPAPASQPREPAPSAAPLPESTAPAPPPTPPSAAPPAVRPRGEDAAKRPVPPIEQVTRKARTCRQKHKAQGEPPITVDYAIGVDGKVTRAVASTSDALGACMAAAVSTTTFPAKLAFSLEIKL
jgi:serine/threonine protein kinase